MDLQKPWWNRLLDSKSGKIRRREFRESILAFYWNDWIVFLLKSLVLRAGFLNDFQPVFALKWKTHIQKTQMTRPNPRIGTSGILLRAVARENGLIWGEIFLLTVGACLLELRFFAYSPLRCFLDAHSHCKQRSSTVSKKAPIVSKKARIVSKKAPKHNCKQKSSVVSRKLPTVSKKVASNGLFVMWAFLPDFAIKFRRTWPMILRQAALDNCVQQKYDRT